MYKVTNKVFSYYCELIKIWYWFFITIKHCKTDQLANLDGFDSNTQNSDYFKRLQAGDSLWYILVEAPS